MTTAIWKYRIPVQDRVTIEVPSQSKLLDIQEQHGELTAWFCVPDTDYPKEEYTFLIYGTGRTRDKNVLIAEYLKTVQVGTLVWHIFQELFDTSSTRI